MGSESQIQSGRQRLSEERRSPSGISVGFRHTVAWCYVAGCVYRNVSLYHNRSLCLYICMKFTPDQTDSRS